MRRTLCCATMLLGLARVNSAAAAEPAVPVEAEAAVAPVPPVVAAPAAAPCPPHGRPYGYAGFGYYGGYGMQLRGGYGKLGFAPVFGPIWGPYAFVPNRARVSAGYAKNPALAAGYEGELCWPTARANVAKKSTVR